MHIFSKCRFITYVYITTANFDAAYFWNPRLKLSEGTSAAGFTRISKSPGITGGYFSSEPFPG